MIITTHPPTVLPAQCLHRCSAPRLRHTLAPPRSDDDIEEVARRICSSFVGQGLLEFNWEAIGPNRLAVHHRPDCFLHLVPTDGTSPSDVHAYHTLSSSTMFLCFRKLYRTAATGGESRGETIVVSLLPTLL